MDINKANQLLDQYIKAEYIKNHSIESQVIMEALAQHFWQDSQLWWITWLLHDLDMEVIWKDYIWHWEKTVEILKQNWFQDSGMHQAILTHTECLENSPYKRETLFDYMLSAAEQITGIIYAYVLMKPEKKLEWTKVSSIKKKLKDKSFAANVNREFIYDVEKNLITLDEFLQISIDALSKIADKVWM